MTETVKLVLKEGEKPDYETMKRKMAEWLDWSEGLDLESTRYLITPQDGYCIGRVKFAEFCWLFHLSE